MNPDPKFQAPIPYTVARADFGTQNATVVLFDQTRDYEPNDLKLVNEQGTEVYSKFYTSYEGIIVDYRAPKEPGGYTYKIMTKDNEYVVPLYVVCCYAPVWSTYDEINDSFSFNCIIPKIDTNKIDGYASTIWRIKQYPDDILTISDYSNNIYENDLYFKGVPNMEQIKKVGLKTDLTSITLEHYLVNTEGVEILMKQIIINCSKR